MAKRKPGKISDQLRTRIADSGMSPYELAEASGVDRSVLSRFINARRSITLDSMDKLCEVLKLRLER